jgi:hypothetical protein
MPLQNPPRHPRAAWWPAVLSLIAIVVVPPATASTESIPRACEYELSFKTLAQMIDAATEFETRLVLLGKHSADREQGSTASDMEEINVATLRNALGEVSGYLLAAANLAAVRELMVDERDRATVNRQLKLIAQQIQEPLSFGLESAETVSAMTKRPGISAEVSKIHELMDETRTHFAACAGLARGARDGPNQLK